MPERNDERGECAGGRYTRGEGPEIQAGGIDARRRGDGPGPNGPIRGRQPEPLNEVCRPDIRSGTQRLLYRDRPDGEIPGRLSHFLERARLDLPDPFA